MEVVIAVIAAVLVLGGIVAAQLRRYKPALVSAVEDQVARFKSHLGEWPPFFVPASDDSAPTAQLTGPSGTWPCVVTRADTHPEFGERWQVSLPGPWLALGVYHVSVSSGETYVVTVQPPRTYMRPAEVKRWSRLTPEQQAEVMSLGTKE